MSINTRHFAVKKGGSTLQKTEEEEESSRERKRGGAPRRINSDDPPFPPEQRLKHPNIIRPSHAAGEASPSPEISPKLSARSGDYSRNSSASSSLKTPPGQPTSPPAKPLLPRGSPHCQIHSQAKAGRRKSPESPENHLQSPRRSTATATRDRLWSLRPASLGHLRPNHRHHRVPLIVPDKTDVSPAVGEATVAGEKAQNIPARPVQVAGAATITAVVRPAWAASGLVTATNRMI